ncbi:hypothetical protein WJS89_07125 [Sphingomicrobium sp. XHP0235]|uniref:hypothetical protein n=1 Tax=Sphingomicrobium aquimarinum TaxID=3133971 RepID=UPI0031FF095D
MMKSDEEMDRNDNISILLATVTAFVPAIFLFFFYDFNMAFFVFCAVFSPVCFIMASYHRDKKRVGIPVGIVFLFLNMVSVLLFDAYLRDTASFFIAMFFTMELWLMAVITEKAENRDKPTS